MELRDGKAEEGVRRGGKKMDPYLLIKAMNIKRPPTSLKTRLFPRGHADGTVGSPKPVLMRIP